MTKVLEVFGGPITVDGIFSFVSNVTSRINSQDIVIDYFTPFYCDTDILEKKSNYRVNSIFSMNRSQETISKIKAIKDLNSVLKDKNYDVVHIHGSTQIELTAFSFASWLNRAKKIIVHSHNTGEKSFKSSFIRTVTVPLLDIFPTDYFACSELAGKWRYSKKVVNNRLIVIKNGIDLEKFKIDNESRKLYREKLGFRESDKVIGHVGRFSYQKNHRFLIDLLCELLKTSKDYKLLLIGNGDLKHNIENYAKEKQLLENIIFTGNVSDVQNYMQAMDIFALPSRYEGLPIVAVEAQACGLPVLLSDNISYETKINDNVEFLSIENMQSWVDCFEKKSTFTKFADNKNIRSAGYDIKESADKLMSYYLD